ncbi:succinyl-diaminopimelate desuccinylase [Tistlia consotensis]|uniref:Succinyl-diaminopimelate desuccinylase n=1 Tax=Tistlia consotensis USBA 355 TaxID=560819 RepID=A0A1Y6B8G3_9PROT|nr:M20/M25/M40 family metallo-hydrolase [Tistlia consotensis]SME98339.1 succinyl-diaminopimelate desuccinylase [Tistlia consotensis USBA 355]SNR57673.1 succinyl-diaminopimelate desuccinylase [Tistlia consotensis]
MTSERLSAALAEIKADESALVDTLAPLIALDTSFPPGRGYAAFADHLEGLLAPLGFACRRVVVPEALWRLPGDGAEVEGERVNLIAERPSGREPVGLYFHVDTVPPGDGWSVPPLALTRDGRRLLGRGTADMKGCIAAVLAALRAAERHQLPLRFDPVLLCCTDEEGGLYPGIRYLAEQGELSGHLLSYNGSAGPRIWAGCFGSLDLRIRIHGRSAHSGDPVGGINAFEEAVPLLNALIALKARVEQRTSAMPPPPHHEGRPLTARLSLTAARGGSKGSALPHLFEIVVNRRYPPEETAEAVLAEIRGTVERALAPGRALGWNLEVVGHLAPVDDPGGPHWPRWQQAVAAGFGYAPESFRRWGSSTSSDMGWVQQAGIREILLGGLGRPESRGHAADEFTTLDDLIALASSTLLYLSAEFGT